MPDRKTRFGVIVDGLPRELFSVREGKLGDLYVVPRRSRNVELGQDSIPLKGDYFSVHMARDSDPPGRLIKRTMDVNASHPIVYTQFRLLGKDGFRTPLWGLISPYLGSDNYTMRPKMSDEVVMLYPDEIGDAQLFFVICVSDRPLNEIDLYNMGYRVVSHRFTEFYLTVCSGFFMLPSGSYGWGSFISTSRPTCGPGEPHHLPPEHIAPLSWGDFKASVQNMVFRFKEHLRTNPWRVPPYDWSNIDLALDVFSRFPPKRI